jgi:hypothetical protein
MDIKELLDLWEDTARVELTKDVFEVRLPLEEASKVKALAELYPRRNIEELITDLLSSALSEVERTLPYIRGNAVVSRDELGDPLYEDVGPTPRYRALFKKHLTNYKTVGH